MTKKASAEIQFYHFGPIHLEWNKIKGSLAIWGRAPQSPTWEAFLVNHRTRKNKYVVKEGNITSVISTPQGFTVHEGLVSSNFIFDGTGLGDQSHSKLKDILVPIGVFAFGIGLVWLIMSLVPQFYLNMQTESPQGGLLFPSQFHSNSPNILLVSSFQLNPVEKNMTQYTQSVHVWESKTIQFAKGTHVLSQPVNFNNTWIAFALYQNSQRIRVNYLQIKDRGSVFTCFASNCHRAVTDLRRRSQSVELDFTPDLQQLKSLTLYF